MKKLRNLILAVVLTAVNSISLAQTPVTPPSIGGSGSGGGGGSVVNSEEVARLIARKGITEFTGSFGFNRIIPGTPVPGCNGTNGYSSTTGQSCAGAVERIEGTFSLQYGRIIDLVINGVQIPNETERYTLPVNTLGTVRHFSLKVEGINSREKVLYGDFWAYELEPSQSIQIVLKPSMVPFFMAYTPESGIDAGNLRLDVNNGTEGYDTYYDQEHGGFNVWVTPGLATSYRIYDQRNNQTIETGAVDTSRLVATPSEEPIVSFSVMGNVDYSMYGSFGKSGLKMDSKVLFGKDYMPAKVVAYNNDSDGDRLQIEVSGLKPGTKIFVKKTNEEMTLLAEFMVGNNDEPRSSYFSFVTSGVVSTAVVTVVGEVIDTSEGFYLGLHRPYDHDGSGR